MDLVTRKTDIVDPEAWCRLILGRAGLTFRDAQMPAVLAAVREQMRASGVAGEQQYYQRLSEERGNDAEWNALVERLLNHETSFFRHPPSYEALRRHILPELWEARGRNRLNLWSAGCSTGQEAYSLAMVAMDAMQESGSGDFTVWGGDLSRRAIDVARQGRYGRRAVAGIPVDYQRRFLRAVDGNAMPEYEIVQELRQRVRFMALNLIAACDMNLNHDVIFCHNVLIYLSPAAVSRVVAALATRLALGGYLMLGPGEAPSERPPMLEAITVDGVRVLRRRSRAPGEVRSC